MNTLVARKNFSIGNKPQIKKILVALDYSATSINAFSFAITIARRLKATIHVLNVYQVPFAENNSGHVSKALLTSLQQKAENNFLEFHKKYIQSLHGDILIEHTLKMGYVADSIQEVSNEVLADLIIMGTQGEKGIDHKLFGRVTWNAIKKSAIPVLAIPVGTKPGSIKNILFVDEGDPYDYEMINYLLLIASLVGAVIYVVHFLQIGNNDGSLLDKIRQMFRTEIDNNQIHLHLSINDNNAEVIKRFAVENEIDMISMLSHHKGLFGAIFHKDVTKDIVLYTDIPILAFNSEP